MAKFPANSLAGVFVLTLLLLQMPTGNCLLQHHRCQSAICGQNATVGTWQLEAEQWINLLNLLCWKPKQAQMIVIWQGGFLPNIWHVFPLFCSILNLFFLSVCVDFQSSTSSVFHQWQLYKIKSVQHFLSYLQYNTWKTCCQQHRCAMSEEFRESTRWFRDQFVL